MIKPMQLPRYLELCQQEKDLQEQFENLKASGNSSQSPDVLNKIANVGFELSRVQILKYSIKPDKEV
jgi:hypothetical protein